LSIEPLAVDRTFSLHISEVQLGLSGQFKMVGLPSDMCQVGLSRQFWVLPLMGFSIGGFEAPS